MISGRVNMRSFSVSCTCCGDNARIYKSEVITAGFKKFYIECLNPDCKHRFVSNLMFSHSISEPDNKIDVIINKLLNLSQDQKEQVKQALI